MNSLLRLFSLLQSGVASLFTNGLEAFHLKVENERIDVDLMNKELLMDLLKSADVKDNSLSRKLAMVKRIAGELKAEGFTLTISYRGSLLLTLGADASPGFSQVFTGTDAIEINNWTQLSQLLLSG